MANATEHRIFHVPEMLEAILHQLPPKDLLFSKGVCKTWKSCIETSVTLNKDLFLTPDGEAWPDFEAFEDADIEPELNPLLRRYLKCLNDGDIHLDSRGKIVFHDTKGECDKTWRSMLLTQPPITCCGTFIHLSFGSTEENLDFVYVTMGNARGLTMGDMICALEKEIEKEVNELPGYSYSYAVDVTQFMEYPGMDENDEVKALVAEVKALEGDTDSSSESDFDDE